MKNLHEVNQMDILFFGKAAKSQRERDRRWLALLGGLVLLALILLICWQVIEVLDPVGEGLR